jgi:imidazole glycerol phosphate synthase glutamine amidotransferase subunit
MTRDVAIVRTGIANTASVIAAFERLGIASRLTDDPAEVRSNPRVILPGVGAFGPAMQRLRECGLIEALVDRIREDRPTLAICLGLQLLCESSEESLGERGLGIVPGGVTTFGPGVSVPQIGWNRVNPPVTSRYLTPGFAYFANSYCLAKTMGDWCTSHADHGGPFVAALERGRILACQFHPELSGQWGMDVLGRWVQHDERDAAC